MRLDESKAEISASDIKAALERPANFGYFGGEDDGMFDTWSLGDVIEHRDSGLLDKSNAKALTLRRRDPAASSAHGLVHRRIRQREPVSGCGVSPSVWSGFRVRLRGPR